MRFFNTLSSSLEPFKPKVSPIKIYSCGPTVYDFAHIGNLRAYIFADVLVRYLKFKGYKTFWVMNITDIDDKTIKGAKKAGVSLSEFTKKYEKEFFKDIGKLNIQKADFYPCATKHIKEIHKLITQLYKKGYAYEKDGSIYYNVSKFKNYGKLSKIDPKNLRKNVRILDDSYNKDSPVDFVLWKKRKKDEPYWILEIDGLKLPGRPGWHIECSAMAMKYLGETLDFHLGGVDLIFPHHENEIAQSEAVTGKKFVNFWLHNEHLLVDGQKMSKSLGNFYTLRDLIVRGFDPLAFRYLCLQSHYRSKMNFTWEALESAQNTLKEIRLLVQRQNSSSITPKMVKPVINALDNDLDTPSALALLHEISNARLWLYFDKLLGLGLEVKERIPPKIVELVEKRELLRKEKKFQEADKIRKKIEEMGYKIEDTKNGPQILTVK